MSIEAKKPGRPQTPNRQGLYSQAAKHATAAINTLADLLQSRNDNIRLGAAKVILDKCLPNARILDTQETAVNRFFIHIIEANDNKAI